MLSLRSFTRVIPRSFINVSAQCSRRTLTTVRHSSLLQQSWKPISPSVAFSTSRTVWAKEGEVDQELSAKLESELELEKDIRDSEQLPPAIQEFLDSSAFDLQDTPGQEEVVLTRQFGDESIRITFNIADLNAMDQESDEYGEDKAQYDEDETELADKQSGGAQSKGTTNQGRTKDGNFNVASEDSIAAADQAELPDDASPNDVDSDQQPGFPARLNVTVEKAGKGALMIETTAQDGEIMIENVYYYSKPELADAQTAEQDWSKRNLYSGPPFGNLDQDLQLLLERYLDERGINTELALWVPEYIDFKEQREYLNWLSNVKSFVDA